METLSAGGALIEVNASCSIGRTGPPAASTIPDTNPLGAEKQLNGYQSSNNVY